MKTAFLLTGHYRTLDQCRDTIIKEFSKFNPDYFINTYSTRYNYHPCVANSINFYNETIISDEDLSIIDFKGVLKDDLTLANSVFSTEFPKFHPSMKFSSNSHFLQAWKLFRGVQFISQFEETYNLKYDRLIVARTDILPCDLSDLNFDDIESNVYLTKSSFEKANDHIMISSKDNIIKVIEFMVSEFYKFRCDDSNLHIPHILLDNAIKMNNLVRIDYPILEYILRANGIKLQEAK